MKSVFMLLSLCTVVCIAGCNSHKEEKEEEVRFLVTSPIKVDTTLINEYVCQVSAARHIELRAQERGYLQQIYVDEGQYVHKGQLLFRVMPRIYEAEMKKAAAEAEVAKIELQNTQSLADNNIVAPNELAMSRAKYDKAKAEMELARVHLDFTEIRAPFNGIIDRFELKLGSLVEEGDLLTTLSDNSEMWVYFNVPEAEYLDYKTNIKKDDPLRVNLLMANNKVFSETGVVTTIEADFNNETGNISFRATFPNPDGLLRHGETGNIQMPVVLNNAIIIPQKATFEMLDKVYVFVVDKDDKVQLREVQVGEEMQDLFVIQKGLTANDKILLEGIRKVNNNDKISYEYEEPQSVIAGLKLYTE